MGNGSVNVFELINLPGVASGILVILVTWLLVSFVSSLTRRLGQQFADRRLKINQTSTLFRFVIWFVGLLLATLLSVRLSDEAVLALTGTAAVTIGFALKDLASSVLAGIIILVDRPFQVGDRVTFAGIYGEVREIGLRSVRLITLDDNVVTIPNNKFLTDVVSSGNWGSLDMLVQMDFYIGLDADVSRAKELVGEAITTSRFAYMEKPWTVLVNAVVHENYLAVRLRAKVYVLDVQYEMALQTDVTERVLMSFRKHEIHPPVILTRSAGPA